MLKSNEEKQLAFKEAVQRIETANLEELKQIKDGSGLEIVIPLVDCYILDPDYLGSGRAMLSFGQATNIPKSIQDQMSEAYKCIFSANNPVQI